MSNNANTNIMETFYEIYDGAEEEIEDLDLDEMYEYILNYRRDIIY